MTRAGLSCFINHERPPIDVAAVNTIPVDVLGEEKSAALHASLNVDESDGVKCATSARLWESLLETCREPFILLRVADMRHALQSNKTMASQLYDELALAVQDETFTAWVHELRLAAAKQSQDSLYFYKTSPQIGFSPSQRWRSGTARDPFPYCRLQRAVTSELREKWKTYGSVESLRDKYLNLHCIETNEIEGTFQFDLSATTKLVQVGFFQQALPITDKEIIGGNVRTSKETLQILRDTRNALGVLFDLLKSSSPIELTPDIICRLHKTLMTTSQVLYSFTPQGYRMAYTPSGVLRSISRTNVSAGIRQNGVQVKIQFCPYDEVDVQLQTFCTRFNELMQKPDMDPFAAAAWISHVFVTIHPFEDGNGRLSRILASIPLLQHDLPPLSIPPSSKQEYNMVLNFIRANRDGDYSMLMDTLYQATNTSIRALKLLTTEI